MPVPPNPTSLLPVVMGALLLGAATRSLDGPASTPPDDHLRWHRHGAKAEQTLGQPAKGQLLIARREMGDPRFRRTVILLLEHDIGGSIGLAINRPSGQRLSNVLSDVGELDPRSDTILLGGPVALGEMRVLVQSADAPDEAWQIFDDVYMSGSADALQRLVRGEDGTPRFRAYAGYSGWGRGQLDREVLRGDWHLLPADAATVFETPPTDVWPELIDRVGRRVVDRVGPRMDSGLVVGSSSQ